ncbi:MAG TPA: MBL fold metallo-hydrolase, partial [Pseudolabrys sp.]|nr:MBL fold metallo-hydrolase [Pseudolabrys sp.]
MQESPEQPQLSIRFWGVRGSIPVSDAEMQGGGGDTACVEMRCGRQVLLFDAGSGLRPAGEELAGEGVTEFDLFLSHWHYDHIIGLPFFRPFIREQTEAVIWAGRLESKFSVEEAVAAFMRAPFFPVSPKMFAAAIAYRDFEPGDILKPREGIIIRTARLKHPGGVVGYRVEYQGKSCVYMTDVAAADDIDPRAAALAANADLLIYDCMYTDQEVAEHGGYGHSTWQRGVRLCRAAGVARLALFHHAPERTDKALAELERRARAEF